MGESGESEESDANSHDVAPRVFVQPLFDRVYDGAGGEPARRVHLQQLALLFITFAMGALHNPELPPHDPSAEQHLAAARWCLVKGDFIGHNTIAGLQAVVSVQQRSELTRRLSWRITILRRKRGVTGIMPGRCGASRCASSLL